MKPTITEFPEMNALIFEGYSPDPETKAFDKLKDWLDKVKPEKPYRIFGHNIDLNGNLTYDPQNAGYKIYLIIDDYDAGTELKREVIKPGKFLVSRAEGELKDVELWLTEGWSNLNKLIQDENLKVKDSPRWYEEHIKSGKSQYMIVDLCLEME